MTRRQNDLDGDESDRRRESRHDPGVGRREPRRPRHRGPGRALPRRAGEDAGERRLQRRAGHLRHRSRPQAHQAQGRATSSKAGVEPGTQAGRAAPRRRLRLRGRPGAEGRQTGERRDGRRHRRQQGQGLRRRHEAARVQRHGRIARRPPRAPGAWRHRRLRHAGPRVQGHADGRPHGRREGDDPEPRGRPSRRRARSRCSSGARCPAPRAALVLIRDAVKAPSKSGDAA